MFYLWFNSKIIYDYLFTIFQAMDYTCFFLDNNNEKKIRKC